MRNHITAHGDSVRWQQALDELVENYPEHSTARRPLPHDLRLPAQPNTADDRAPMAPIGIHLPLDALTTQALERSLAALHPWRKGPWWLHGIHLDTEWRCDWKWQRLEPHLPDLRGQRVLDVGCGNGYYGWHMLNAGVQEVVGIDPTVLFVFQHAAMNLLLAPLYPDASNFVLPLRLEDLPRAQAATSDDQAPTDAPGEPAFDSVFSMGVLYHRRDPIAHLRELRDQLKPGGTLVLETLVCEHEDLAPQSRYARMRNVHLLPRPDTLRQWLLDLGFESCEAKDICRTTTSEQRSTRWMRFESLANALDANNPQLTVEGHPAPVRASFVAHFAP